MGSRRCSIGEHGSSSIVAPPDGSEFGQINLPEVPKIGHCPYICVYLSRQLVPWFAPSCSLSICCSVKSIRSGSHKITIQLSADRDTLGILTCRVLLKHVSSVGHTSSLKRKIA